MKSSKYKLTVIIVNWNSRKLLQQCLNSLYIVCQKIPTEIIVVDNNSEDNSVEMVRKEFPDTLLIKNKENIGFAKANNKAIPFAKGEYILLLNTDVLFQGTKLLIKWLGYMDRHLEVGASGCRLVFEDKRHQVGDAGYKPSFRTLLNFSLFLSRIYPQRCKGIYWTSSSVQAPVNVDWVCGAAFLIRRRIIATVGLLDEANFMYAEDIEWGCRITTFGFKVNYLPWLEVIHLQGGSSEDGKKEQKCSSTNTNWLVSLRQLYKRYNPKYPIVIFDIIMTVGYALRTLIYLAGWISTGDSSLQKRGVAACIFFRFCFSKVLWGHRT